MKKSAWWLCGRERCFNEIPLTWRILLRFVWNKMRGGYTIVLCEDCLNQHPLY